MLHLEATVTVTCMMKAYSPIIRSAQETNFFLSVSDGGSHMLDTPRHGIYCDFGNKLGLNQISIWFLRCEIIYMDVSTLRHTTNTCIKTH